MKDQVQVLLNKKMDRQEFIKQIGLGLIAMTGVSAFVRSLAQKQKPSVDAGYGASAYGGVDHSKKIG